MTEFHSTIDEAELHAWVDGRLDSARAQRVALALESDPQLRACAEHYRQQNDALRALLDSQLHEPIPAALAQAARQGPPIHDSPVATRMAGAQAANRRWFAQAAALFAAVCVGALAGWFARGVDHAPVASIEAQPATLSLTRAAAIAHAAYVPEVRHPVEVGASEQEHLVAWLSKRLGTALKVPDLQAEGFSLVGGRLLPDSSGGVAAQFMFENSRGQRLTLFMRRDEAGTDTAFRYAEQGPLGTFFWLDRGFGYALSGELPREAMVSIATAVYRQLNP